MKITAKTGETLNFLESGVDGIYVLDRAAFKAEFNKGGDKYWEESTGKRRLEKWAEENLPTEILGEYEVDIPAIEEVLPQKMLDLLESRGFFTSRQFPIFQNSGNRMMEFDGKPVPWWTKSAIDGLNYFIWVLGTDGSMTGYDVDRVSGFVPVLRRKSMEKRYVMTNEKGKPELP